MGFGNKNPNKFKLMTSNSYNTVGMRNSNTSKAIQLTGDGKETKSSQYKYILFISIKRYKKPNLQDPETMRKTESNESKRQSIKAPKTETISKTTPLRGSPDVLKTMQNMKKSSDISNPLKLPSLSNNNKK